MTRHLLVPALVAAGFCGPLDEADAGSVNAGRFQVSRRDHISVSLPDGDVLLLGKAHPDGDTGATDRFDAQTNTWVAAARHSMFFAASTTVLASGKVAICGMFGTQLELYDPVADIWTTAGNTDRTHAVASIFEYAPQKVLIAGGERSGGFIRPEVDTFDFANQVSGFGGLLQSARSGHIAARLPNGRIMVAGGFKEVPFGLEYVTTSELYDPDDGMFGTWVPAGSMGVSRVGAVVVPLADGRIFAIGGEASAGGQRTTEIFNPTTMTWSPAASMLKARHQFTATRLADGRVVVIGGMVGFDAITDVEVYDPVANRWSWSVPLPSPRGAHTANLLPSGEVLVAGGQDRYLGYLDTSLRYTPENNDLDDDLVQDQLDNCPTIANPDQANVDGDALGDACDDDDDGDGLLDGADNCPRNANADQLDTDGDAVGDACDDDDDGDGLLDGADNCPRTSNADQANLDGDALGDVCDDDDDGDGLLDGADNCPRNANADQLDTDGDAVGDACDDDDDGDGLLDGADNCPRMSNADQANLDGDALGDICDDDDDGDGDGDGQDNCPRNANADQADVDLDGVGNLCDGDADGDGIANDNDSCPMALNPDQTDLDGDGLGNPCDLDVDGDGVANVEDNCPLVANSDQDDADDDTIGTVCDRRDGTLDGGGCSTGRGAAGPLWLVLAGLVALFRRRARRG